jgi:hypothetical protein
MQFRHSGATKMERRPARYVMTAITEPSPNRTIAMRVAQPLGRRVGKRRASPHLAG